jgi:hypothetical protein
MINNQSYLLDLLIWDNDPHDQVEQESWNSTWKQGNQESQPEPERTDTKEVRQTATHTGKDAVPARAT